ncbi:MAG TPA: hypothetical protein PK899_12420, partial [Spirochaetota bacterium]|nr:hypothetical protein [Spirochaetota bacterium]
QLSRPDKSGNSRFEYTKMLNNVHVGTLSGSDAAVCVAYVSILFLTPYVSIFYQGAFSISFLIPPRFDNVAVSVTKEELL